MVPLLVNMITKGHLEMRAKLI